MKVSADCRPRMPNVNHCFLSKVFDIGFDDACFFEENGACSYCFFNIPVGSVVLVGGRSWIVVGEGELVGVVVVPVGIDILCFELVVEGEAECSDGGVDDGRTGVDLIGAFDFSIFC